MAIKPKPTSAVLQFNHYAMFGGIVHNFARTEWLIQLTIAALAKIELAKVIILTKELGYRQKRDTLYSYMELHNMPGSLKLDIKGFLDEIDKYNVLRNNIAHAGWIQGKRNGTIKPLTMIVRGGRGKIIGRKDIEERDYTELELMEVVHKLQRVINSYIRFMRNTGLFTDMEANILARMEDMADSEGALHK